MSEARCELSASAALHRVRIFFPLSSRDKLMSCISYTALTKSLYFATSLTLAAFDVPLPLANLIKDEDNTLITEPSRGIFQIPPRVYFVHLQKIMRLLFNALFAKFVYNTTFLICPRLQHYY